MRTLLVSMILLLCACHRKDRTDFYASFENVDNLVTGSELRFKGIVIGHVTKLQLRDQDVIVGFRLDNDFRVAPGSVLNVVNPFIGASWVELHRSAKPGIVSTLDTLRSFYGENDILEAILPDSTGKIKTDSILLSIDSALHHLKMRMKDSSNLSRQ